LGIETSCDDTGVAVVNGKRTILGESLASQTPTSVKMGGVIPPLAQKLHVENIGGTVLTAIEMSGVSWDDLDAIAVTVKPGMALSLKIGVTYAKQLAVKHNLPIIPVHHMEAHALTAMLTDESLTFPFLALLVSGGHSLLALAKDVDEFLLLGTSLDMSPGDCLDKIARRLHLATLNNAMYSQIPGGMAIELMARTSCRSGVYPMPTPRSTVRDCDFSFSGIRSAADRLIARLEKEQVDGILPVGVIASICASCQTAVTRLFCRRVQRAIEFCVLNSLLPSSVVSGGVASNLFIRSELTKVAAHYGMRLVAPPPRLCTDNGVMVAWNGVLLHSRGKRIEHDPSVIDFSPRAPLGKDIRTLVANANIQIKPLQLARSQSSGDGNS
uniref:N(6)-L-threonylcarbamoyladenine synthase n=1 Tax=Hydatigena taeniaeformis TaxID=6205 RepID=A0A0R3WQJ2_HYDTA